MSIVFLRKLVVFVAVFGVLLLATYTYYFTPKTYSVYDFVHLNISEKYLEKTISLYGTIREPTIRNDHLFFELCSGSTCMPCVIFNYKDFQKNIVFNNNKIKVTGKHTTFNNQKQIIVQRLDHVNS